MLTEARRLIAVRVYGAILSRLFTRACELLDEIDEILLGLQPDSDHEAFVRVAALHREFAEIQSLVPRNDRSR
jgi:transcriptional regulator NrdR family protein